jgi:hypothetical protein
MGIHATPPFTAVTLPRNIAAIQVVPEANGRTRMGLCTKLKRGSPVEICGAGFSDNTVKIRSQGALYFVLLERVLS